MQVVRGPPPIQGNPLQLETNCIRLAKCAYAVPLDPAAEKPSQRWAKIRSRSAYDRAVRTHYTNGLAHVCAEEAELAKAQHWMRKLNVAKGLPAELRTLNTLLRSLGDAGDVDAAEDWFNKLHQRPLHPELINLSASNATYDIMVQNFAKVKDMARAQKYMDEADQEGYTLSLPTYVAVGGTYLDLGDCIRAQSVIHKVVTNGCSLRPGYPPSVVLEERRKLKAQRQVGIESFVSLVASLTWALANAGNTQSANLWLQYLADCGIRKATMPELWEHVRLNSPLQIVPSLLSGEQRRHRPSMSLVERFVGSSPEPMKLRPALLSGETTSDGISTQPGSARPSPLPPSPGGYNSIADAWTPLPTIGTSPEQRPSSARTSQEDSGGARPQCTSPALRRLLNARAISAEGRPYTSPGRPRSSRQ